MFTDNVLETMSSVVEWRVELYKSDFYSHDWDVIEGLKPSEFVWFVRNTGTHLVLPPEDGNQEYLDFWHYLYEVFKGANDWFYYVRMNDDGSGEIIQSEKRCDEFAARMAGRRVA